MPVSFCVPECHQKKVKSPSGEKEFFFSVIVFTSEGKTDKRKEFLITKGTVKVCLLHFRLEGLRKYVTDLT